MFAFVHALQEYSQWREGKDTQKDSSRKQKDHFLKNKEASKQEESKGGREGRMKVLRDEEQSQQCQEKIRLAMRQPRPPAPKSTVTWVLSAAHSHDRWGWGVCVLSHFSQVRLVATPWTIAHQAPLSVGLSR